MPDNIIQGTSDFSICGVCHEAYDTPEDARGCDCADIAEAEAGRQLTQVVLGEMGEMD